jgi:hypothetical protein
VRVLGFSPHRLLDAVLRVSFSASLSVTGCFADPPIHSSTDLHVTDTSGEPMGTSGDDQASAEGTTTGEETGGEATSDEADDSEVWSRHTFDMQTQSWTSITLDRLWTEANAPPSRDIAAAVALSHFDRLLVISTDGVLHERVDGLWNTPVLATERFPSLEGLSIAGMTHTPQAAGMVEHVYFIDNPTAVIYAIRPDGEAEHYATVIMEDDPDGAPQETGRAQWYFELVNLSQLGAHPEWLRWFIAFDDDRLYRFDVAAFAWASWPIGENDFFGLVSGQPDPHAVRAAYTDDAAGRVHFITP